LREHNTASHPLCGGYSDIIDAIEPIRTTAMTVVDQCQATMDELRQGSTFEVDRGKTELHTKSFSDSLHNILTTARSIVIPRESAYLDLHCANDAMKDLRREAFDSDGLKLENCLFLDEKGVDEMYRMSLEAALDRANRNSQEVELSSEVF
jgi:hypothetical protein